MGPSCEDPVAWKKAMELATAAYATTGEFPERERVGLTQQIRRDAGDKSRTPRMSGGA